ncbi:MAG TPA: sugar ABC transporter substrate-binding protein [Herpetosiphon sp.]|uniref:Extracellular solute-binding protein family 1 n=1 Tax=Herpetosiphon aurantiacus (strain ATCC 23779 / DSM 785 / 114-95) TaxID=316274 RepID=A9B0S8_HERA2|nr:sugar ABC transporter substrate-binding protein [Herpetosiphon sp.]ABX03798.1 extracellular solute-binding protein family 1 [Herpetosiphon aurantiacus DSM 785]HBW49022.1 sugar ABC transporter substrate-binding protein [Herpetosiphon sp.]
MQRPWIRSFTLLIGLILAACGEATTPTTPPTNPTTATGASSAASGTVTLWFHSGQGAERDALNATLQAFAAKNSAIKVEAIELPEGAYNDQVNAAALAGELPCLLDFDGPFVYNYAWSGYLQPLDSLIAADVKADFLPSIIEQGTYNGKLYSLGQFDSGLGFYANKELLEKAGVRIPTLAQPWTRAELDEALSELKANGLEYPLDLKMDYGRGEWFSYGFSPFLQSFGGDLIDRSTYQKASGSLNSAASVEAMKWFQGLFTNGYVNPKPAGSTDFAEGKAALSWVGHWAYPDYAKALGDKLLVLPAADLGKGAKTGMGSWNWGITSKCANPAAAAEVLSFIVSPEEVLRMSDANGAVPARTSAIAKSKLFGDGAPLNLYVQQLTNGVAMPRPITPAYPVITVAFAEAVDNIVAGADVQAELDKAAQKIDADIEDNQGYPVK